MRENIETNFVNNSLRFYLDGYVDAVTTVKKSSIELLLVGKERRTINQQASDMFAYCRLFDEAVSNRTADSVHFNHSKVSWHLFAIVSVTDALFFQGTIV